MTSDEEPEEDGSEIEFHADLLQERGVREVPHEPAAWHKPRKQWIRREQWGKEVAALLDELRLTDREFRYLTLPGEHLFDVRQLHSVCEERKVKLRYLGFDTSRKNSSVTVSEQEVRSLPFIHGDSLIKGDKFEALGNPTSAAYQFATHFKSFDAVNLDLCDSVASRKTHPNSSSLNAIFRLVQLQAKNRTEPWLLFVTTRAGRESVNAEVTAKLLKALQGNITSDNSFRIGLGNAALFNASSIDAECDGNNSLIAEEFVKAFGVGFSKWLLHMAKNAWSVRQQITAWYRVFTEGNVPDMLSLTFRFERIPVSINDPNEIITTKPAEVRSVPSVTEMELGFLAAFADLIDLDRLLHDDSNLREEMVMENANLMSRARFNRDDIIEWGRKNCWQPADA